VLRGDQADSYHPTSSPRNTGGNLASQ